MGIQQNELKDVLVKLGSSPEEAHEMFLSADDNCDGRVDYEEFLAWLFVDTPGAGKEKIQAVTHMSTEHRGKRGQAIRAAKNAANEITPQGIKELTGLVIPPGGVCDVLAATLWLLGEFPDLTP